MKSDILRPPRHHVLMATRLLSFLTEIEQALVKDPAENAPTWNCQRIVNFKDRLARMTLSLPAESASPTSGGSILLQSFLLGDGSLCLRAVLSWDRSSATNTIAVHAKPGLDWVAEAKKIASAWQSGPPATATIESVPENQAEENTGVSRRADKAASG